MTARSSSTRASVPVSRSRRRHAVIVGAGPVGCLAARLFSAHGYTVELVEKRPDPRVHGTGSSGRTINLSVSPRGVNALTALGCRDALKAAVPMDRRIIHTADGRRTATCYDTESWRNHSVARSTLNHALLQESLASRGVRVRFATRCSRINFEQQSLTLTDGSGRAESVGYDVLVGADGAYSTVRQHLADQNMLAATASVLDSAYKELTLTPRPGALHRTAIHVWPRRGFFLVALPDTAGTFRGTLVLPRDDFDLLQTGKPVREFVHQHFPDVEEDFTALSQEFGCNPVSRITTASCDAVSWRDSVILMGDAAHTVAPFLGQGVNLGFEDCLVLHHLLGDYRLRADALAQYSGDRTINGVAAAALSMDNYSELTGQALTPAVTALPPKPAQGPAVPPAPILVNFLGLSYSEAFARLHSARTDRPATEPVGSARGVSHPPIAVTSPTEWSPT
ncbi:FAD-dependent oxidoreductase [Streptomyces sp. NPDC056069]|uniref:FAD-dependent oxidoreductase n=1 Tax=Streptomyces sp. NPDC056069 TaxID=3345702 RepID=UPI0035D5C16B